MSYLENKEESLLDRANPIERRNCVSIKKHLVELELEPHTNFFVNDNHDLGIDGRSQELIRNDGFMEITMKEIIGYI